MNRIENNPHAQIMYYVMYIIRGLDTKAADKEAKEERLKKMWKANGCHQKAIKYPKILDSILVIEKKYLDLIFKRIKTLELRPKPLNYLNPGDVLYLQETTKPRVQLGVMSFSRVTLNSNLKLIFNVCRMPIGCLIKPWRKRVGLMVINFPNLMNMMRFFDVNPLDNNENLFVKFIN